MGTFVVGEENVVDYAWVVTVEGSQILVQQFYVDHSAIYYHRITTLSILLSQL